MKKLLIILCIFALTNNASAARKSIRSSSSSKRGNSVRSANSGSARGIISSSSSAKSTETSDSFASCMDNICKSNMAPDKGRCRCSSQLTRIEKILRDIEKIQNEADEKNKNLEALMNVSNSVYINDSVSSVYDNINSIEKKSKTLSSQKLDGKYLVMEGLPLYNTAVKECKSYLPSDKGEAEKVKQEYQTLVESDCSAYTTVLKEKADSASNLLTQAQKNQEMFEEQEYKKRNQLDVKACYVEYEACLKTQCGENYTSCLEKAKLEANLKKCESINYGKCEDNKSVVILDLRKAVEKAKEKERIAQSCRSAMGQIVNGKCLFEVMYVADQCTSARKCGDSQTKHFNPGATVTCDDRRGDFKELLAGCKESCFLIGSNNEERKIGTNAETSGKKNTGKVIAAVLTGGISLVSSNHLPGCKADKDLDKYKLPVPDGWGRDGYPVSEELKKAF